MNQLARQISLTLPRQVEFGRGSVASLARWASERGRGRTLVVADAFNASRVDLLGLPGNIEVFGSVRPEPDRSNLERLLATASSFSPDLVVGFGGGSAMDLAKLAAVLVDSDQTLDDVVGVGKVDRRICDLAQVPTTSGTGSEAGTRSLVTDDATRNKLAVESRFMLADFVALDPDLTLSVPPAVTAATGVDALAHCVEAFTNVKAHPVIDGFAREGMRLVGRKLATAVEDGGDVEARSGMMLASFYGGICLGPVNTAAGHAVAYPLGTRHGVAHGAANALIFPHVLAYNAPSAPERTAEILDALGLKATSDQAEVFALAYGFCAGLGLEMTLSGFGVPVDDLSTMADEAVAIRRLLDNNPRPIGRDDILQIYRAAY